MNITHKDFIGNYENAFSKEWCNEVIKYYEFRHSLQQSYLRDKDEILNLKKQDTSCSLIPERMEYLNLPELDMGLINHFHEVFWGKCYDDYKLKYNIINTLSRHGIKGYKIQKTLPSQGYHIWHCENDGNIGFSSRLAVYTVYLNDVEEGGETEFLYQSTRVKAKQGTCSIFPASYTHTHRGNPPLSGEKYIMTGWIEYV
jgi:hypothetical protein